MATGSENGATLERSLLKRVGSALESSGLARDDALLLVAVSGGPDSLAMLLLLAELSTPLGLKLHVAHLDHGLRGQASADDACFVEDVSHRLALPFTTETADVESHRTSNRLSVEEAARELRYGFLARTSKALGATAVTVGHTADDQVETVMMHLLRGSGQTGLAGMPIVRHWPSVRRVGAVTILRPLLSVGREETAAYCDWKGLTPRDDPTNRSPQFTRNRVRMELLPHLNSFNPRFGEALLRLSDSAQQDQMFIQEEAARAWNAVVSPDEDGLALDRKRFSQLAPSLKRHLLRLAYEETTGLSQGLEYSHVLEMVRLSEGRSGTEASLPAGLLFSVSYDRLHLRASNRGQPEVSPLTDEQPLLVPGHTGVPGWSITARIGGHRGSESPPSGHAAHLDATAVGQGLVVRHRRPGDRFQPLGMESSKKLQDFMVDARIPRKLRDSVPLVASDAGVVWVVGYRIAHWARLREETKDVLEMEFSPAPPT